MTLELCKECNKTISTLAKSCPNCGAPNSTDFKKSGTGNSEAEWTVSEDKKLLSLYNKNVPEFELSKILKKRITEIRKRIIF